MLPADNSLIITMIITYDKINYNHAYHYFIHLKSAQ